MAEVNRFGLSKKIQDKLEGFEGKGDFFTNRHFACMNKKAMRKYIIFYVILHGVHVMFAQRIQVDTNANYVIANGGLNLRSEPNQHSKKLSNIPFGSTIEYVSDKSYNIDSIRIGSNATKNEELIKGNWVKVEYKNKRGYVLDIFLNRKPNKQNRFSENFDNSFVLLYPGCGCDAENLHNPNGWKWFGYFKKGEGNYSIEEVNISYYRTRIYTCDLLISASKSDSLSFIIGSKKGSLSTKKSVWGKNQSLYSYEKSNPLKKSDLENVSIELIESTDGNVWQPNKLYLVNGKHRQLLNKPEYDYPVEIKFVGDLDGDSKVDYIIKYGDKGGVVILYLTSTAKSGNLILNVAMFFASYCC